MILTHPKVREVAAVGMPDTNDTLAESGSMEHVASAGIASNEDLGIEKTCLAEGFRMHACAAPLLASSMPALAGSTARNCKSSRKSGYRKPRLHHAD